MWFEQLMGFVEESPEQVRANITLDGVHLTSRVNGRRVRCGHLETPSLTELRGRAEGGEGQRPSTVREVVGDVRALHMAPENAGALFQAASQFNLLEMVHPAVTPEHGVGIYERDLTQGPACAIVCGGGTIVRNYFVNVGGQRGQTAHAQLDCIAELGQVLGPGPVWEMRNGYALATEAGLHRANEHLTRCTPSELDRLRGLLRIGVQRDVEVLGAGQSVTQVYGSALPVAYGQPSQASWELLARLVLEASYEATLLVAREQGISVVYLTLLGGGVFGNDDAWIADSVVRAARLVPGLDIRIVSFRQSHATVRHIVDRISGSP